MQTQDIPQTASDAAKPYTLLSLAACLRRPVPTGLTILAIVLSTAAMAAVCLHAQGYLGNNDAFYYLAIADNWLQKGVFLDATTEPAGPVITPQNGIVGVFYILRLLSLTKHQCLLAVLGLNYVLLLSCFYPLIRLCRSVGIESRAMLACVLLVFVAHMRVFMWVYMSPVNDMIFFTGQLWLLYLMARIFERSDVEPAKRSSGYLLSAAAVALAAVLIHFRLNIIFIPLGGIAAAVLARKFRYIPLMIVMLIAAALSLSASYLVVDRYDFQVNAVGISTFLGDIQNQLYILLFRLIPESLFRDLQQAGNLLYMPFYMGLLLAFIQGVRQRNMILLLTAFVCAGTFALTALHGNVTERYLWAVTALMYMLLFRVRVFRALGVLFVVSVLINSVWSLGYKPARLAEWQSLAAYAPIRQENVFVLAQRSRECWYFTGRRSPFMGEYTWSQVAGARAGYLIGPRDYIDTHVGKMKDMASANSTSLRVRPIDYGGTHPDMLLCEVVVERPSPEPVLQ